MKAILAPSILSADFSKLGDAISSIHQSTAPWVHIDVMDGVFVPNISFGMPIIKAIRPLTDKFFDCHLMIVQPERYIQDFKDCGVDLLTVHLEASTHLHRTIQSIKAAGMKAGVALNPHTSIHLLDDCLNDIDLVCVMSVNPGFGGQSFIENTYKKVSQLKEKIIQKNASTLIEIDGGVSLNNAIALQNAGADVLVAGNSVFSANNIIDRIKEFNQLN
jgi:ribulose-phosphate 3-epimerase